MEPLVPAAQMLHHQWRLLLLFLAAAAASGGRSTAAAAPDEKSNRAAAASTPNPGLARLLSQHSRQHSSGSGTTHAALSALSRQNRHKPPPMATAALRSSKPWGPCPAELASSVNASGLLPVDFFRQKGPGLQNLGRNGFSPPEQSSLVLSLKMGCADTVHFQPKPNTPF